MFQCSEHPDGIECQSSSALELVFGCFARLLTGDWTNINEDIVVSSVVVLVFVISWYITFCMLKISSLWEKSKEQSAQYQHQLNTSLESQRNDEENSPDESTPDNERPVQNNAEMLDQQADTSVDADFRAAGDGWEADDDVDYIVDTDLIQGHTAYSDEDSEDDVVVLRRIIMAADDVTAQLPESEDVPSNQDQPDAEVTSIPDQQELNQTAENVLSNIVEFIEACGNEDVVEEHGPEASSTPVNDDETQENVESDQPTAKNDTEP
uniref:uncharacterized protein LOC120344766 n=1 Tax=Styela clava TaxID=7725 RepID=UPI00193AD6C6|nr:uncharacterized protein LOC120344766 [Styela clava]